MVRGQGRDAGLQLPVLQLHGDHRGAELLHVSHGGHAPGPWEDNKEALLTYVEAVQAGLRGIVRDAGGEPVANANIEVASMTMFTLAGIEKNVTTSFRGEYWRLLAPGKYWQVLTNIFS